MILTVFISLNTITVCQCATQETSNYSHHQETKSLVVYFSAQNHTKDIAEKIVELTGADIFRIEPATPYAANPYDDAVKIREEAYNGQRPAVKQLIDKEQMAKYDTIYIGTPVWWHQPAMVVLTFLESYDLTGKTVIPFVTYGESVWLNEVMQKIYHSTPDSKHLPTVLPEDIDPDDFINRQNDDAGISMPERPAQVAGWLKEIGVIIN